MSKQAQTFSIDIDGQPIPVQRGQTIAAALIASGRRTLRRTQSGAPRGIFCGMGVCFDCLVTVNGVAGQRACTTLAEPGMQVHLPTDQEADHDRV